MANDLVITEVDPDEVRRALAAYRTFNRHRAAMIAWKHLQALIDCSDCLGDYLQSGDDPDQIRDQLREISLKLRF